MQRVWIGLILFGLSWTLSIDAKAIIKGPSNETLLVGQIYGPSDHLIRDLVGMMFSMDIYNNNTIIHSSQKLLTVETFPFNYSAVLSENNTELKHLHIICTIWQPAYIYDNNVQLNNNELDTLDLNMHAIKFVIIHGEIVHDKHMTDHNLSGLYIKLELVEDKTSGHVVDQIDFQCSSKKYPCPFEYWVNPVHVKSNAYYRLEAVLADHLLPARKTIDHQYKNITAETKFNHSKSFKINLATNTEINGYKITVAHPA